MIKKIKDIIKDKKVIYIFLLALTLMIIGIVMFLSRAKKIVMTSKTDVIYKNILEIINADSYVIDNTTTRYVSFDDEVYRKILASNDEEKVNENGDNKNLAKEVVKKRFIKKDKNYHYEYKITAGDVDNFILGLLFNNQEVEIITPKSESIKVKYEDIPNVIKTYIPQLSEFVLDFKKINISRYTNIYEDLKDELNKVKLDKYKDIINKYVDKGDKKESRNIVIELSMKDDIDMKLDLLYAIKNDKEINTIFSKYSKIVVENIEKNKDYKKIRFNDEEFEKFKAKNANFLVDILSRKIDKQIEKEKMLLSIAKDNVKVKYEFYLDKDNRLNKVKIFNMTLYSNNISKIDDSIDAVENKNKNENDITKRVCYYLEEFNISKVNEVKSNDIIFDTDVKINLANKTRSELFQVVDTYKYQYEMVAKSIMNRIIK